MYQRPKKTITDEYQNEESIQEKLKDYVEINPEEIDNLPVDTHLRYITYNTQQKKELFRFGGFLKIIHPKYIILKTKKNSFSVQRYIYDYKGNLIYKTRFFKNWRQAVKRLTKNSTYEGYHISSIRYRGKLLWESIKGITK